MEYITILQYVSTEQILSNELDGLVKNFALFKKSPYKAHNIILYIFR